MKYIAGFIILMAVVNTPIEKSDPELDNLIGPGTKIEIVAQGFRWAEGPVWDWKDQRLLFSDVNNNRIHEWKDGKTKVFLEPSGLTKEVSWKTHMAGSNGLGMDAKGRLLVCRHGDRTVVRRETDGTLTVIAEKWKNKRLNSPNDIAVHPSGDIYFTDPCFGLKGGKKSKDREIDKTGVYRIPAEDKPIEMVADELMPNGIAFSPNGKTLYITNGTRLMRCERQKDGYLTKREVFFKLPEKGAFDGMTVDEKGNVYACNWKGGVFIISPKGKHLGTIRTGRCTANCTFGGEKGNILFIASQNRICRVKMKVKGVFGKDKL